METIAIIKLVRDRGKFRIFVSQKTKNGFKGKSWVIFKKEEIK